MKICKNCQCEKQNIDFYQKIGWCKVCHNARMRKWQKEHPESCKKAWTKGNRKRCEGRKCKWCGQNYKISTSQKGCSLKCRFELNVDRKDTGCWHWKKKDVGRMGYGVISIGGKNIPAHRFSYEFYKGKLSNDLFVLHTCDNPICVNPDHLYVGNHQDNMNDMNSRGRGNKNRWHYRKYSREICLEVIRLRDEGKFFKEISEILGIKESSCKYIYRNPHRLEIKKGKL